MRTHYAVTGLIPGTTNAGTHLVAAQSVVGAVDAFAAWLYEGSYRNCSPAEIRLIREGIVRNWGRAVCVTRILASESPIWEVVQ
jgi:hypothetical protein